jgi:adenosylhomocysteine nucleosidase
MICYAFPLAHEAAPLLRRTKLRESFSIGRLHCTLGRLGDRPVLIALIGMGEKQALEHVEDIFRYFQPTAVVLAGYGGALIPQLKVGQIVISNNFTTEQAQSFLRLLTGFDFAGFCTTREVVATPDARARYASETRQQVAEMETAPVAEFLRARQIVLIAVRVISDESAQVLPVGALAAGFDPEAGRATPGRLLARLLLHPGEIAPFARFVGGLSRARQRLAAFLLMLNAELPAGW